jgi:uncharacterized protein YjiS (DUF1127 family)
MSALWDWGVAGHYGRTEQRAKAKRRFAVGATVVELLRLWGERHRRRQELAMLAEADLRDTGVPRDLVAHEAKKWPWQAFHPQLQTLEEAAQRRIAGRR